MTLLAPKRPCAECPWRTDVAAGRFQAERFALLASSAYDQSFTLFQCHKTSDTRPVVCAGFILQGSAHNLSVRMAQGRGELTDVAAAGLPLFPTYRAMAIANGVPANHYALTRCRDD